VNDLQDPWVADFMNGRKHKIENDVPYIDLHFETLAGCKCQSRQEGK
jgi:hypothetical protein